MTQVQLKEGAMNVVDTVIVFRILKMMTRKWSEMDAYKFGLIDDNGKRIKTKKPKTSEEKNSFTLLHRLVFNLKRVLELLPFGRTRLASYAASLALLKEHFEIDGKYLMNKGMREGVLLGKVLRKIEEEWMKNNFKISDDRVQEIIKQNS